MKLRNNRTVSHEAVGFSDPYSALASIADSMLQKANGYYKPENVFPGFVTALLENGITVTKNYSRVAGEQASLIRSDGGIWTYWHVMWRPGSEYEHYGTSLRSTTSRPVSATGTGTHEVELCTRMSDGSMHPEEVVSAEILAPMTPEECNNVAVTFQDILDKAQK